MKVIIVAAMSVDGMIGADESHNSRDWRSKDDGKLFSRLVKGAGVMVMGSTTYKTFRINRAPFGRRLFVYTHNPASITLGENVEATDMDPIELVELLRDEGYPGLAVCGGASINSLFLEAGVVDELYLTVEPILFGKGVPLLRQASSHQLTLLDSTTLGTGTTMLHYAVQK